MAASSVTNTLFTSAVKSVFDSWTVLQLAVNHGFGGSESREKAEWMVFAVDQWFKENRNIESYELEDFLEDVMNTEFDAIVDDGSLPQKTAVMNEWMNAHDLSVACIVRVIRLQIANMICGYYRLCSEGKEEEVKTKLQLLPKSSVHQCARVASEDEDEDGDSDTASSSQQNQGRQPAPSQITNHSQNAQTSTENQEETMETEDDGWHVVKRGKRK